MIEAGNYFAKEMKQEAAVEFEHVSSMNWMKEAVAAAVVAAAISAESAYLWQGGKGLVALE